MNSSIADARFRQGDGAGIVRWLTVPLVQGGGAVDQVGMMAREAGLRRVLLVTDRGLVEAGHASRVEARLASAGIAVERFDEARENPTTDDVEACLKRARSFRPDGILGLGGGSSLDTAKGCNFLLTNGGRMHDYWGRDRATRPLLPFIAVPTTAGTGSECQQFALISDADTHRKMACGDPKALARWAVLDPVLTATQPRWVTACTGLDAIAHAVECAVTLASTPGSLRLAAEAFRWLDEHFLTVLEAPTDLSARAAMQWGAALGGAAIERSMLGAAHAAANPLTAHYGVVHGQAVGRMLPAVVRWNAGDPKIREGYARWIQSAGPKAAPSTPMDAAEWLAGRIEAFLDAAGLSTPLSGLGVTDASAEQLGREAAEQWTAQFNPRPVTSAAFAAWYREVLQ